jgi:hypothetical protein
MGILSKGFVLLAAMAVGAGLAMRPSAEEVRGLFRDRLAAQIADGSILPSDNGAAAALLAACQISPSQCARVLEGAVSMQYENRWLWASVRLQAPGFEALTCTAALDRLLC